MTQSSLTFREALSLWLGSHGLTHEEREEVLSHPRMELSLRMSDPGGALTDLTRVLSEMHRIPNAYDAYRKLSTAEEKFFLMQALHVSPARTRDGSRTQMLLSLYLGSEDTWFIKSGSQLVAADRSLVRRTIALGEVTLFQLWTRDTAGLEASLMRDALPGFFEQFADSYKANCREDAEQGLRATESELDLRRGFIQVDLALVSSVYLSFFENLKPAASN